MKKSWLAILVFLFMTGQKAVVRNANMNFAETSWPDVITDSRAVIFVGQIRLVEGLQPVNLNQQTGTLAVAVLRELTPGRWTGPSEITVGFTQLANERSRLRVGNGGWNGVDVKPGAMLLMGITISPGDHAPPAPLSLEAVSQVSSLEDFQVAGIVQALRIEAAEAPQDRMRLLTQALDSNLPVLQSYAHFALGRKQRIPRNDAASLEIGSLLDATRPDVQRLASESTLELELWKDAAPDDPVNKNIVTVFLQVLARREPGLRRSTTVALHRIFYSNAPPELADAQMYRSNLLRGVQIPDRKAVLAALSDEERDPNIGTQATQLTKMFSESNR